MDAAERKDDDKVELCDVGCSGRDTLAREIMDSGIVLRCGCAVVVAVGPLLSFTVAAVAADASAIPVHTYTSRKRRQSRIHDTRQLRVRATGVRIGNRTTGMASKAHRSGRNTESTSIKQAHAAASACVALKHRLTIQSKGATQGHMADRGKRSNCV